MKVLEIVVGAAMLSHYRRWPVGRNLPDGKCAMMVALPDSLSRKRGFGALFPSDNQ
jgi:hypothetical protein